MKAIIYRTWLAIAGGVLLAACSSSTPPESGTSRSTSRAVTQLFMLEPTPDRNTLQKTATGYLATLLADPANQEITLVKVDPTVVSSNTQDLAVTLPNGKTAQFHLRDYNTITPGIEGWVGYKPSAWKQAHPSSAAEIENDPFYYLSLARQGDTLVGDLRFEGQAYRIESVSPGQQALIKVDGTKLPPDAKPLEIAGTAQADEMLGKRPTSASSIIRVLLVTTNELRQRNPNYRVSLANALQNANQYMINSQVPITFEIAAYYDADHNESGRSMSVQLSEFSNTTKGFGQQVFTERGKYRADLATLYVVANNYCGQAQLSVSKQTQGYSIINCSGSLGHEMGHNLGAMHRHSEPANVPEYAYGYKDVTGNFHTQMRTSHGALPYFANPRLSYNGRPLGDPQLHDVARRFNERREIVESLYPPPLRPKMLVNSKRAQQGKASCLNLVASGTVSFASCDVDIEASDRQWKFYRVGLRYVLVNDGAESRGASNACLRGSTSMSMRMYPCPKESTIEQMLYWEKVPLGDGKNMLRTYWTNIDYCLSAGGDDVRLARCNRADSSQRWDWEP